MSVTDELLAELEDLGAIGDREPLIVEVPTVLSRIDAQLRAEAGDDEADEADEPEEVELEEAEPDPDRDVKSHKIVALTDLVIEEFDRMIAGMSTVRDAVKALREELVISGPVVERVVVPARESAPVLEADDYNAQGDPDSWGNITLSIPPSVPLPKGS